MKQERYHRLLRHLIALHEAAHALVGLHYSWPLAQVRVASVEEAMGAEGAGSVDWSRETDLPRMDPKDPDDRRQVWELMVIAFAGPVASARSTSSVNPKAQRTYLEDIIEADDQMADRCARWLADHRQHRRVRFARSASGISRCLVDDHWEDVERLAPALRDAGEMSQIEIEGVLRSNL